MPRFGEFLVEAEAIDQSQFEEALRSQQVYGGRIGTNLVELGYLVLDDLAEYLSRFHNVPQPPTAWLEQPDSRAIKLVPMALIRRYQLLPLRLEDDKVHVAMLDPSADEQLDFVAAAARRPVEPYLLPEVRLLYWLETHCGLDRHPRYVNLAARSRHATTDADDVAAAGLYSRETEIDFENSAEIGEPDLEMRAAALSGSNGPNVPNAPNAPNASSLSSEVSHPKAPEPAETVTDLAAPDEAELLLDELAIGEEDSHFEPSDLTPALGPAPDLAGEPRFTTPAEVAALEAQLQGAGDVEDIVGLGLRIARAYSCWSAVFVVRGGQVSGLRGEGDAGSTRIDAVGLPSDTPSIFTQPALNATPFRGQPPHDGVDGRVLDRLGRPEAHEVLIQPIVLRGRVVNLLYSDNGPDALGDTSVAALNALARTMASAYERLILDRKQRGD